MALSTQMLFSSAMVCDAASTLNVRHWSPGPLLEHQPAKLRMQLVGVFGGGTLVVKSFTQTLYG